MRTTYRFELEPRFAILKQEYGSNCTLRLDAEATESSSGSLTIQKNGRETQRMFFGRIKKHASEPLFGLLHLRSVRACVACSSYVAVAQHLQHDHRHGSIRALMAGVAAAVAASRFRQQLQIRVVLRYNKTAKHSTLALPLNYF